MVPIILFFEGHRAFSWNGIYKTTHWANRQLIASQGHNLVQAKLIDMGFDFQGKDILKEKVTITFTAAYKSNPVDPDNICAKIYIDGMKHILLSNDTLDQIDHVVTKSIRAPLSSLHIAITPTN